jgi:hypothetical protein
MENAFPEFVARVRIGQILFDLLSVGDAKQAVFASLLDLHAER